MASLLGCAVILLLSHLNASVLGADNVEEAFNEFSVVPDVIPEAPSALVKVVYSGDVEVSLGNELQVTQMLVAPAVDFEADSTSLYTLAMVDPDAPSRSMPTLGQVVHWLVGNIPGNDVSSGQALAAYLPPSPPPGSGLHRYVYLVYQQPKRIEFNTALLNFSTTQLRVRFSINDFARNNGLGKPLFGNFCQARILPLNLL